MSASDLSRRAQKILHAVVTEYLQGGDAVGSRTVTRRHDLGLSPATVRNVMADLEEMGMLEIRGPTVAPQFPGWLATGDLGSLDGQGRVTVLSRRSDLIVSGGENIYPAELERVLGEHPAVREVAVAPRADARWGQVPVAVVVWRGPPPAEASVLAWCRTRLAGFKLPRHFIGAETLPRNANGKVDRARLRALAA